MSEEKKLSFNVISNDKNKTENINDYYDDETNLLSSNEKEIFDKYKSEYLNKNVNERIDAIQEELIKTLIYIDTQLKEIESKTEGKAFQRSVYEQKGTLINLRIKILEKLSELQLKEKEEENEEYSNITEILGN